MFSRSSVPSPHSIGAITAKKGKKFKVVSAVLRQANAGEGWDVIDDSSHSPIGLDATTPVEVVDGKIKINFDFTSTKIGSLLVVPDEGYAATPLTFGSSVGTQSADIELYHPFEARIAGLAAAVQTYHGADGGDWSLVADASAGTWTFTHNAQTHSDSQGYPISVGVKSDESTIDSVAVSAASKTGFTLQAMNRIAGRTNGASVITENVGVSSVAWDGASTLTITHPKNATPNDAYVVSNNARYSAAVTASTDTTITVQFYDISTGTLYSGGSKPAEVRYMRGGLTASSYPGNTDVHVSRGPVKVDAGNVAGASSNIWVYGVFEVA